MRPATFEPEEIIAAGNALLAEGVVNITGFALRKRVGGGDPSRLRQVWDGYLAGQTRIHEVNDLDVVLTAKTPGQIPDGARGVVLGLAVDQGESPGPAERVDYPGENGFGFSATCRCKEHNVAGQVVCTQPQLPAGIPQPLVTDVINILRHSRRFF
ncbi:hypothetical protein DAX92_28495 [Salmonella enterica subsp. enterica]|uniref:KfrA N-terminal DNA-binding domain-containing protein n=1 Tax=Salmonella enterica I TaxID=59201 RepID=A0A7Z1PYR4_SALET|nr:hypothetical protein DAX92_28495 [Salmonella enterica subsp. enterica]PUF51088.1 hypothetical protein DAX73_27280 [Salmonella enterica subsp. enterica]